MYRNQIFTFLVRPNNAMLELICSFAASLRIHLVIRPPVPVVRSFNALACLKIKSMGYSKFAPKLATKQNRNQHKKLEEK
jgi:hypothetical protein